jgi:DNA-binding LacI/PurR family transcriptional regulator
MLAGMADLSGGSDRARPPTIVDVARCAGVSIATVSRVVTGTGRVKEATRARVEQAIAATGWTADPAARVLARSRERIAMITGPERNPCARERRSGYRDAMRSAGRPKVEVGADFTRAGAARATRRLLATHTDLDAIFAGSDLMATAVLQVVLATGRRIPDDVAVVGFDDSPQAVMTPP